MNNGPDDDSPWSVPTIDGQRKEVMHAIKNDDDKNPQPTENAPCVARIGMDLLYEKKLTVPQAAKMFCLGQTNLRNLIKAGTIPVLRLGISGKILILERDLADYLQGHYGPLKVSETPSFNRLRPLPDYIAKSELLLKARGGRQ